MDTVQAVKQDAVSRIETFAEKLGTGLGKAQVKLNATMIATKVTVNAIRANLKELAEEKKDFRRRYTLARKAIFASREEIYKEAYETAVARLSDKSAE